MNSDEQTLEKPRAALQTPLLLINSLTRSWFVEIYLRCRHALVVKDGAFSQKVDYVSIF